MIVTEDEVQRIYRRRFGDADKKAKADVWKVVVESFFQRWVKPSDVVLDLGCGYGEFLNFLKCQRRIGVDLNPDSQTHLHEGIEFHQHTVCNLPFLPDNSVDFIFTSNLMEHLPGKREVEQMSREALRVLKPGGHFVMMGPNLRFLPGTYWDFWDHVVPITDRSLVECLENLHYDIVDCHAKFLPYTTRSSLPQAPWMVSAYLHLPFAWKILGKQFLIRARKPLRSDTSAEKKTSVVVPVYNEAANIVPCLNKLRDALQQESHEILVCYDFDGDSTLPAIHAMNPPVPHVRLIKNNLGRGVAHALQAGFNAATGDVVVSTMADLSDPPEVIPQMAEKIREGADVVSGSRYMQGGAQHGGPFIKRTLSRLAGLSLRYIAGIGTHDATTNFRAYSARFLKSHPIESAAGFEVALELTTKAHLEGAKVAEVPSTWHDRTAGESRFQLKKWLPKYLRWYRTAMLVPAAIWIVLLGLVAGWLLIARMHVPDWPVWDELSYLPYITGDQPITWSMLWAPHNDHRILIPKIFYIFLMRLANVRPLVLVDINIIMLALATSTLLLAVRAFRGRMKLADASLVLVILALSQYQDVLWAFQLWIILSASLILLLLATALRATPVSIKCTTSIIGAITCLLPFCGGQGMATAPAFVVWLLAVGGSRFLRRKGRPPIFDSAVSLTWGLLGAASWIVAMHGLPPSPAFETLRLAFHSWKHFEVFLNGLYSGTMEFSSTSFLPESTARTLPYLYHFRFWGGFSILLFLSSSVLLTIAWFRRPAERFRTSALSACLWAFFLLNGIVYLSRGVYGVGASSVARYSTVAMPLLAITVVVHLLYGGRKLAFMVPSLVAISTIFLALSPYGNYAKLKAYTSPQQIAFQEFKHDIWRPEGSTVEELAAHYAAPLFGPGDVRAVPDFIRILATHKIGPFRGYSRTLPSVATWNASPFPVPPSVAQYGLSWDGTIAHKSPPIYGVLILAMDKPTYLSALRLTFRLKTNAITNASLFMAAYRGDKKQTAALSKIRWGFDPSETNDQTFTASIYSTVDRLEIDLPAGITEWTLIKIERLDPVPTR